MLEAERNIKVEINSEMVYYYIEAIKLAQKWNDILNHILLPIWLGAFVLVAIVLPSGFNYLSSVQENLTQNQIKQG